MQMMWNWNPLVAIALLLPAWAYAHGVMHLWRGGSVGRGVTRWQAGAFALGVFTLFIALISPVDTLGEQLLSVHMVQHLLLMLVAPPLLALAVTPGIFLWVLPLSWRRALGRWSAPGTPMYRGWETLHRPVVAWLLHAAAIWLWHVPGMYQAALTSALAHWLEHASFFGSALLFWRAAFSHRQALIGVLLIFTTALHSSLLGALMTFSRSVWYPIYTARTATWGISPLEDQQLAGLLMWIPSGAVYVLAALWLLGIALHRMDNAEPRTKVVIE
jgi:cytochrome c oxidase assembly factor CtaG